MHRRLFKLVNGGFLTTIKLPQQKHIYGFGKASLPILVEQGIADEQLLSTRLRTSELKPLFLKHEMLVVDIHVMLSLASSANSVRLVSWQEGRGLFDFVTVADHNELRKLPIGPDAFFTLEDSRRPEGANRANFFLEADRSSETHTRFRDKIRAYWHYLEQGLHAKKFGIKSFRILTVTLTDARAENLCRLAESMLPDRAKKHYLLTSLKKFSLENPAPIFDEVYLSPRPGEALARYPLVPTPSASQTA